MKVELRGVAKVKAKGRTYYYAWRGGPRLRGEPGSPEFLASYNEAVATKITAPEGRLLRLLQDYQRTQNFLGLRNRTQSDYTGQIKKIELKFGDMPIKALADRRARGVFMDWRDELALSSLRGADYTWTVLAAVLAWAKDRGKIPINPCERGGRVYNHTRVDKVWSIEDEEAFLKSATAHLHLPLLLALWTGQRQGDLLRLPWSAYDGKEIRLRQSKSVRKGSRRPVTVTIPVGAPLKEALDAAAKDKRSTIILTTDGRHAVDTRRLPRFMGQGMRKGRCRRSHIQRPAGHRSNPAGSRRMHRGGDR